MYGMLSGGHHQHHHQHHQNHNARSVHGVSMLQQQPLVSSGNNNNLKSCFSKAPPCSSSSSLVFNWAEPSSNHFESLEFASSGVATLIGSSEPTSVLDLRSPSPNNSRALSACSSSSSDCKRRSKNVVDASSCSHHQAKVKSTTIHQVTHHDLNSSHGGDGGDEQHDHQLQDELQQAVAAAGYGVLPLFYSAQGIRPVENLESSGGGGGDQWLLQDVLGSSHHELQGVNTTKQKFEELESELLSSSSPAASASATAVAQQENSSSTSFMRWFLEEPGVSAPDVEGLLPPWQQQQQQHQMMMMMVKQEDQHQPPSTSLHPQLAHLESFTRRTLPLVSSSHEVFQHQHHPIQFQEQSPFVWQQNYQQGCFQPPPQIHHQRDPFLLGMLQDDPQQQQELFGSLPRPPPFLLESLASQNQLQQMPHHHHHHHHQVRDIKQQQRMPPRSPEMMLNNLSTKRELPGYCFEPPTSKMARTSTSASSPHLAAAAANPQRSSNTATTTAATEEQLNVNWCSGSSSGASFVSRLLLRAAEACESGQREHAQSILARLNDHHQHHQLFLQQQQQQQQKHQPGSFNPVSPAQRTGFIFRDILSERLSKLEARGSSSSPASSTTTLTSGFNPASPGEIVERVQACKSLLDDSGLLRYAHFVANQAISEAIEGEECVHILDLSEAGSSNSSNSYFGGQWSSFIASFFHPKPQPKPVKIRLTLASTREQALCFAISSLRDLTREYSSNTSPGVGPEFEFHGVLTQPGGPINLSQMGVSPDQVLIVNFVLGLHKLAPASEVLESVRGYNPKLVLLVEQELEVKSSFVGRFRDGLEHYTAVAESVTSEDWTGEDSERVERLVWRPEIEALLSGCLEHQRLENWRLRMAQAGFAPAKLSEMCDKLAKSLFSLDRNGSSTTSSNNNNNASSITSNRALLKVVNEDGSLMLSFRGKHLASASAWKCC